MPPASTAPLRVAGASGASAALALFGMLLLPARLQCAVEDASSGTAACPSAYIIRGHCVPQGVSPLHFYVHNVTDSLYNWVLVDTFPVGDGGATAHVLNMTSQAWLEPLDFKPTSPSKSVWVHQLIVIRPPDLDPGSHTAWLWVTGGDNSRLRSTPIPSETRPHLAARTLPPAHTPVHLQS